MASISESQGLVRFVDPQTDKQRLRRDLLLSHIASQRDAVAAQELELQELHHDLGHFEHRYRLAIAGPQRLLRDVEHITRQLRDEIDAWRQWQPGTKPKGSKRKKRVKYKAARPIPTDSNDEPEEIEEIVHRVEASASLKSAYRALARRFHPDLARTEEEHRTFSSAMAQINALYRARDLEGLLNFAAGEGALDFSAADDLENQIVQLEKRVQELRVAVENLHHERAQLEQTHTCALFRNATQAEVDGRNLLQEIAAELEDQARGVFLQVRTLSQQLETTMKQVQKASRQAMATTKSAAIAVPDFFAHKPAVRLGLRALERLSHNGPVRELANKLAAQHAEAPAVLHLLFLAHVIDLFPKPPLGLETYADLALRMNTLHPEAGPHCLEEALAHASGHVHFGTKVGKASPHATLLFDREDSRAAVARLAGDMVWREEFRKVLQVVGPHCPCPSCKSSVFAVPLWRSGGLDDLRAEVCPACGSTLKSYRMPHGKDVQALLNPTFVEMGLVIEWVLQLGRASIITQMVPVQVEELTAAGLCRWFASDVLGKHGVEIAPAKLVLETRVRGKVQQLAPRYHLAQLLDAANPSPLRVRFAKGVKLGEQDVVESVRYKIRHRYAPDGAMS